MGTGRTDAGRTRGCYGVGQNMSEPKLEANSSGCAWLWWAVAGLFLVAFGTCSMPIPPNHARRDALLYRLREIATRVNAYRQQTGTQPASLAGIAEATDRVYRDEGYQLISGRDGKGFLVASEHISFEDQAWFRYGCDQDLQIQKVQIAREYYQGNDQFQWYRETMTGDVASRHRALIALCEIARNPGDSFVRCRVIRTLGDFGPEAKAAVPVLLEICDDKGERVRALARATVGRINPALPPHK